MAAAKAGVDHGEANQLAPRLEEIPFTSERRRMTTLHDASGERVAYSKGAADIIMEDSSCWSDGSQESAFTPEISRRHARGRTPDGRGRPSRARDLEEIGGVAGRCRAAHDASRPRRR